ncbi:MAG: hypothetical protein PHD37_13700 [Gallionellaceae bacterium]|nr:hypothetical protein [Gallionellaceae bacterium]
MLNRSGYAFVLAALLAFTACGAVAQQPPFWASGVGDAAARFELAKRSEPELITFLRRMPKGGDLHNHLSGATYSDYLLDSARANGLNYDLAGKQFTKDVLGDKVISVDALIANSAYLAGFLDTYSMRGWYPNTNPLNLSVPLKWLICRHVYDAA